MIVTLGRCIPDCVSQPATEDEAFADIGEAIAGWLEVRQRQGCRRPSLRYWSTCRMPPDLPVTSGRQARTAFEHAGR
ncbi:MAG: type II toxin-antitoxin system HicB family antitoxin [Myxococcales bacterium]|nr:type II toxin-antitoxin system HicB family antitoxin [Myxococcales bacterium]